MARKISHSLINGRAGAGTGGQGLKVEWAADNAGQRVDGDLHWMDVSESSLEYVPPVWYGDRGVFVGGYTNIMEYVTISSTSNTTDFGDLLSSGASLSTCSDGSRGVMAGNANTDISYITISTTGNATDFGDLTKSRSGPGGCSDGVQGFIGSVADIDYITIQTAGNASSFGNLVYTSYYEQAALANNTRAVWSEDNHIDYITTATTGNALDFGDLTVDREGYSGSSTEVRGVWIGGRRYSGGWTRYNTIDYITIATTGNATDFGDLLDVREVGGSCANETSRCVIGGGANGLKVNSIEYFSIDTTGNALDFGDLSSTRERVSALSGD